MNNKNYSLLSKQNNFSDNLANSLKPNNVILN